MTEVKSPSTDPRKTELPHVPSPIQGDTSPAKRPAYFRVDQNTRTQQQAGVDYPTEVVLVPLGFPEDEEIPIPVYVVSPPPVEREIKRSSINRVQVDENRYANLASDSDRRTRLLITNTDAANSVFLTKDASTPVAFGYELTAGTTLELLHNDPVWAKCAVGDTAYVCTIAEFYLAEGAED